MAATSLEEFLAPLQVDLDKVVQLAKKLESTYRKLALESQNQFLPTPISDSLLKPEKKISGKYLAIDIGGTNVRVGFVELSDQAAGKGNTELPPLDGHVNGFEKRDFENESRVRRTLEKSWPIGEQLKYEKAEDLFYWIGERIAEVVSDGKVEFKEDFPSELPMGVTFSFPMIQHTLSDATLMSMGKGFTITSNLDLGKQLRQGYAQAAADRDLPKVKIVAIVNDAVATFVSFVYQLNADPRRKAAMGLIVGTGNNATIPLRLNAIHPDKRVNFANGSKAPQERSLSERIVLNTEWSINGTGPPLKELDMITKWDRILDAEGEAPGFMPFEQMSAGRYLGELGRLMILDYLTTILNIPEKQLPPNLRTRHGITTTLIGKISNDPEAAVRQLEEEIPAASEKGAFHWDHSTAALAFSIGKAIQTRAAGMTAAAIIGLLACADEIPLSTTLPTDSSTHVEELIVGYTGGCIVHFHDYLHDCQAFLDQIIRSQFPHGSHPRVVLQSCHDGGIIGAGVLAGSVQSLEKAG